MGGWGFTNCGQRRYILYIQGGMHDGKMVEKRGGPKMGREGGRESCM